MDQTFSVKMAGYWPRSFFASLWTRFRLVLACVAGARKGKGEKKSRARAREALSGEEGGRGGRGELPRRRSHTLVPVYRSYLK